MKHRSKIITAACVAAFTFTSPLFALPRPKKSASPAPSASPSPTASAAAAKTSASASPAASAAKMRPIPFHGKISAVDAKAKTFTIAGLLTSRTFKISDKTVMSKTGAPATMKDVVAGEEVAGSYWKQADGSLDAKTVKLGPPTAAEQAKKDAAKAKRTEKKAEKGAEKKASPSASASPAEASGTPGPSATPKP